MFKFVAAWSLKSDASTSQNSKDVLYIHDPRS